jgi:2-polyprenyl-6-methoxyphenol hydroxylase-like FAD-dependent oxidoreductase
MRHKVPPLDTGLLTLEVRSRGPLCTLQGGCTAFEDSIALARVLHSAWAGSDEELQDGLAEYEHARRRRCWPLSVRSRIIGGLLQSSVPPVVAMRDAFAKYALQPDTLLGHTLFDVGKLPM